LSGEVLLLDSQEESQASDLAAIEQFTANQPNTAVLWLCVQKDAEILTAAMKSGIREVLQMPVVKSDLVRAIRRLVQRNTVIPADAKPRAHQVAFLSCKGGSGATFLATNYAYLMAEEFSQRTAFLDLDLACGDAVYYLAPGPGPNNITQITSQIDRLDAKLLASSVLHVSPHLDMLPSPEEPDAMTIMQTEQLERLIDVVSVNYEVLVLDLGHSMDALTQQALDMADVVYVVMQNLLPFLRDAKRVIAKCRALGYDDRKIRLIVNRYEKSDIIDLAQIEKITGLKVSHTILSSFQDVAQAINTGIPLVKVNAHNAIVKVLREMVGEFKTHANPPKASWLREWMRR
jgi:pilus assembly protein CpaE